MNLIKENFRWNWRYLLYAGIVLIDFFFFIKFCFPAAEINQFFIRDILRTKELLSGHFIAVGPDFTSGTYAPGPFYYFILAPIVLFTQHAQLVLIYLFALKTLIQFFFSRSLEKIFSISFFYFYLILSASPLLVRSFYWPNNSTLIIPLGQLLCLFAIWYYQAPPKKQTWLLALMATFWALSMQVHFSLFLAGPLLFFLIAERNHSIKDRLKDTALFSVCALAALAPFIVTCMRAVALKDGPIFYVQDFGFSFFFKYWGIQMGRTFTSPPRLDRFQACCWFIFFYTLVKGTWILFSKRVAERNFYERLFLSLSALTCLMSAWVLSGGIMRYYAFLYSLAYLFLALEIHQLLVRYFKSPQVKYYFAGLVFAFSWLSMFDFYKELGFKGRCENCVLQVERICEYMNAKNVSYQEFVDSTYELLEEFNEGSAALTQECFNLKSGTLSKEKNRYLLVHAMYLDTQSLTSALEKLPVEIRDIYQKDRLKLEFAMGGFSLYSIAMKESELASYRRLTNLAFFYEVDPAFGENYYLSKFTANNQQVSRAQICPTPLFCDVFVKDRFENGILTLELQSRIFQTKYDLDPVAARAQGLKLNYLCDGTPKVLDVISTLGASNGQDQNYSFFTPLIASFKIPCNKIQLTSFAVAKIDLFYTKTGMDHLKDQEYKLSRVSTP